MPVDGDVRSQDISVYGIGQSQNIPSLAPE